MSTNTLYWAVFRDQAAHHMYIEIEDLGRNRWQCVVGEDEFVVRSKSKDFLTVLGLAVEEAMARRDQPSSDQTNSR